MDAFATISAEPVERPFEIVNGRAESELLLLCDHASNSIPPAYADLGLGPDKLRRHIAFDIGAGELTRGLAAELGVPAVLSRFSRLLVDLNRGADDPTLIMRLSDGVIVPGNARVDARERESRVARYHEPYHAAIAGLLDRASQARRMPAILSIHSFTPTWRGIARPWHAGVLSAEDRRFAGPLLAALRASGDILVGDNEPYSGALKNDTLHRHGALRGLASAGLEVRQDLLDDAAGIESWVKRLVGVIRRIVPI